LPSAGRGTGHQHVFDHAIAHILPKGDYGYQTEPGAGMFHGCCDRAAQLQIDSRRRCANKNANSCRAFVVFPFVWQFPAIRSSTFCGVCGARRCLPLSLW
jgi:hypothetical protein